MHILKKGILVKCPYWRILIIILIHVWVVKVRYRRKSLLVIVHQCIPMFNNYHLHVCVYIYIYIYIYIYVYCLFTGFSARDFILQFCHKVLLLFKLLLLEKRIVFYQSPVQPLCATILTLLSLFPDMIEHGLQQAACVRYYRNILIIFFFLVNISMLIAI